jgi:hypothetical protein
MQGPEARGDETMKLGKEAQRLLVTAAQNTTGHVSTCRGHQSGKRNSSFGVRQSQAAQRLRDLGLLEFVDSTHDVGDYRHGYGTHYHTVLWRITEAGRKLA